jgi:hypothetical protein
MNPTVAVGLVGGTAVTLMGAALWFVGNWWLDERDRANRAEFTIELNLQAEKYKEDKEKALSDLAIKFNGTIRDNDANHKKEINDLTRKLATATQDAQQTPIAFGDDLLREFIYVDCLWSQGEVSASVSGQSACRDEASIADPTRAGFSFSVLNPEFIRRWGEACREYDTFGGGNEWREDNPGITEEMCAETLVVFTPEFARYLTIFLHNGANYTIEYINHALEQDAVIDKLTERKNGETTR